MKMTIIFAMCILTSMSVFSKETVEININVKNDLNQTMQLNSSFGISPLATDILDTELGEQLLPPAPFKGFYAAFEFIDSTQIEPDGSKYYDRIWTNKDLRHFPDSITNYYVKHKMIFRFGSGKKIIMNWNKNSIPEMVDSIFIKDGFNGLVIKVNMKEQETMEWENDGILELYIHVYYNLKNTSVSDLPDNDIQIYPNPSDDYISIDVKNVVDSIELLDIFGRSVLTAEQNNRIYIGSLPSGVYAVRIKIGNSVVFRKIIKK